MRFQNVLQSVRRVAGFVETTGQYATRSLALQLGHALKMCNNTEVKGTSRIRQRTGKES